MQNSVLTQSNKDRKWCPQNANKNHSTTLNILSWTALVLPIFTFNSDCLTVMSKFRQLKAIYMEGNWNRLKCTFTTRAFNIHNEELRLTFFYILEPILLWMRCVTMCRRPFDGYMSIIVYLVYCETHTKVRIS